MTSQEPERSSDNDEHLTGAVMLPDAVRVPLRPIFPDDVAALQAFHRGLSQQSVYLRFFAALPENSPMRHLFRDLGFPEHTRWEAETMRVEIDLAPDDAIAHTMAQPT